MRAHLFVLLVDVVLSHFVFFFMSNFRAHKAAVEWTDIPTTEFAVLEFQKLIHLFRAVSTAVSVIRRIMLFHMISDVILGKALKAELTPLSHGIFELGGRVKSFS